MQVASRLVVVWLVTDLFPDATTPSPFYSSMLLAWSTSEIIRYSYFVLNLGYGVSGFVTWLRYNAFFVLYPVGIGSEIVMVWKAKGEAGRRGLGVLRYVYWGQLLVWLAGELRCVRTSSRSGVLKAIYCLNCFSNNPYHRHIYTLQSHDDPKKKANSGKATRAATSLLKLK